MRRLTNLILVIALAAVGCGGGNPLGAGDLGAPDLAGGVHPTGLVSTPTEHRASPSACSAAPSLPACQGAGSCMTSADCTGGQNGRCIGGGIAYCSCVYDQCSSDADCQAGQACACHLTYREAQGAGPNSCVPANCRSDADCASGFCSPSHKPDYCQSYVDGYYCHTAQDECGIDADCVANGVGYAVCAYKPDVGHWGCVLGPVCAG